MPKDTRPRIIVYMEGGVIHDVQKVGAAAKKIILELRDYDIEGVEQRDIRKDTMGAEYQRFIF